jgi:hypothetical protein
MLFYTYLLLDWSIALFLLLRFSFGFVSMFLPPGTLASTLAVVGLSVMGGIVYYIEKHHTPHKTPKLCEMIRAACCVLLVPSGLWCEDQ